MELTTTELMRVTEFESMLNEFSGKRYHVVQSSDLLHYLVEVVEMGNEKTIVEGLTLEQLYAYFKRHLKVTLESFDGWKALDHVKEFWDKLDPRDRDILLNKANFKINTLCDWRVLSRSDQEKIVRWCYY